MFGIISSPKYKMTDTEKLDDGKLILQRVPADDSCLFSSICFLLREHSMSDASKTAMRRIIAQEVAANPQKYDEAFLGKSNEEYCNWIQQSNSWGGGIEISIFSNFFNIEIDVVDAESGVIHRFGEDRRFRSRVFLFYENDHYSALYVPNSTAEGMPVTVFPVDDSNIYNEAKKWAQRKLPHSGDAPVA